jgi:dsRNA-specific ribonuclease
MDIERHIREVQAYLNISMKNPTLIVAALIPDDYRKPDTDFESSERLALMGEGQMKLAAHDLAIMRVAASSIPESISTHNDQLTSMANLQRVAVNLELALRLPASVFDNNSNADVECLKALIGGVYLDQGASICRDVIEELLLPT